MDLSLTKEQKELLEKAEWLASERLAPRAEQYDAAAGHTLESWNDVWENGLLTLTIPQEYGGVRRQRGGYAHLRYGLGKARRRMHKHRDDGPHALRRAALH